MNFNKKRILSISRLAVGTAGCWSNDVYSLILNGTCYYSGLGHYIIIIVIVVVVFIGCYLLKSFTLALFCYFMFALSTVFLVFL